MTKTILSKYSKEQIDMVFDDYEEALRESDNLYPKETYLGDIEANSAPYESDEPMEEFLNLSFDDIKDILLNAKHTEY